MIGLICGIISAIIVFYWVIPAIIYLHKNEKLSKDG